MELTWPKSSQTPSTNSTAPSAPVTRTRAPATASATPSESADPSPVAVEATPSEQATVSTGIGVELVITAARAKSWLFVSDAAGRTLFSGKISRGVTKTFSTDISLNVKVGNAGGVDLTVNGRKVDSIGADGEVVSVSYGVDS